MAEFIYSFLTALHADVWSFFANFASDKRYML